MFFSIQTLLEQAAIGHK